MIFVVTIAQYATLLSIERYTVAVRSTDESLSLVGLTIAGIGRYMVKTMSLLPVGIIC